MTEEEAQKVLDELNTVRIEVLNDEAKRLFEAIMKIADNRDELQKTVEQQSFEISSLKQVHEHDVQMIDDTKGKAVELYDRIEQKDKIIDLMAEEISKNITNTCPFVDYNYDLDCENKCNNNYKECWKQYFENKAKNDTKYT